MVEPRASRAGTRTLIVVAVDTAVIAILLTALLVNIFERKTEARDPFFRVSPGVAPTKADIRGEGRSESDKAAQKAVLGAGQTPPHAPGQPPYGGSSR